MYTVLVCGGRDYKDMDRVFNILDAMRGILDMGTITIIQGGASGADALAKEWCELRFVHQKQFDAKWKQYGKAAGMRRNNEMLNHLLQQRAEGDKVFVLAFPGGDGTANMVGIAKNANVPTLEL
jgi:hypothetical protein